MHFHLSGKPETEKSLIGIYFADSAPDKDLFSVELPALFGVGAGIDIPPGDKSFTDPGLVHAAGRRERLLGDGARALSGQGDEGDGDAARRVDAPLLWINDWDFNWQDSYVYKEPFTLPEGHAHRRHA